MPRGAIKIPWPGVVLVSQSDRSDKQEKPFHRRELKTHGDGTLRALCELMGIKDGEKTEKHQEQSLHAEEDGPARNGKGIACEIEWLRKAKERKCFKERWCAWPYQARLRAE